MTKDAAEVAQWAIVGCMTGPHASCWSGGIGRGGAANGVGKKVNGGGHDATLA